MAPLAMLHIEARAVLDIGPPVVLGMALHRRILRDR
jgi:hypothetical protein